MISRRDFLKSAGAAALTVAAAGVLAGCSAADVPNPNPTPAPAPAPDKNTESKTYKLGDTIEVADGVKVTVTGKRYTYYNPVEDDPAVKFAGAEGVDFGFIGLTVKVQNDSKKDFAIDSQDFILTQSNYAGSQYPLNVKAYGVGGTTEDDEVADGLEYLTGKFMGDANPPMDAIPAGAGYDVGAAGTELAAVLGFLTNANEANDTATLTYAVGSKVYKIKF